MNVENGSSVLTVGCCFVYYRDKTELIMNFCKIIINESVLTIFNYLFVHAFFSVFITSFI